MSPAKLSLLLLLSTLSSAHAGSDYVGLHPGGTAVVNGAEAAKLLSDLAAASVPVRNWNPNERDQSKRAKGTIALDTGKLVCRQALPWGQAPTQLEGSARCEGVASPAVSYLILQAIKPYASRDELSEPGASVYAVERVSCRVTVKDSYGLPSYDYSCRIKFGPSGLAE